ncbi:MarR family winged helix-turn-helix transcriptional regulator [Robertkochia solimangrovi]|uniref:MarR family winged helix-turn-helix transcriptional regulator n=1 Tax=Robertkochia solimangrovi TaxID=2213046 RepID=UPI00117FC47F|nr:MarR family transcriptional regulator [Robertkochia solimangrovi]TRZ43540.1 MarR family transcriptional regulator [Robertkochia solimangrovi]
MEKDFIRQLGYRALDNRLKRISDRMTHDTRKFFKQIAIDVEPSWHLVFKLFKQHKVLTMVEIAEELGYTHPSTVVLLRKMTAKGYIIAEPDPEDKRKQNLRLTQKSIDLLPELEHIWESCERAILQMLEGDLTIISYLDDIEEALKDKPFNERFYTEYQK